MAILGQGGDNDRWRIELTEKKCSTISVGRFARVALDSNRFQ